jgi:hypothetical protein
MGADYSLGVHRLQETIDHSNGSIPLVKLVMDSFMGMSVFESLDSWVTEGSVFVGIFGTMISTNVGGGVVTAYMVTKSWTGSPYVDFSKNPFFQTTVLLRSDGNCTGYITAGDVQVDPDAVVGFGFKVYNGTLRTFYNDGSGNHTHYIQDIVTGRYCLRAYIDSIEKKIYFYVNGELVYTVSDIYIDISTINYFLYYIHTSDENNKYIYPIDWLFQQDR